MSAPDDGEKKPKHPLTRDNQAIRDSSDPNFSYQDHKPDYQADWATSAAPRSDEEAVREQLNNQHLKDYQDSRQPTWDQLPPAAADDHDRLRARGGPRSGSTKNATEKEVTMPSWTKKDERQYDHIKESQVDRGSSEERAKEVAARTVNKQRRSEGRTPNKTTQGTGNPNKTLEERTVAELRNLAAEKKISGRSSMRKQELISAIRHYSCMTLPMCSNVTHLFVNGNVSRFTNQR